VGEGVCVTVGSSVGVLVAVCVAISVGSGTTGEGVVHPSIKPMQRISRTIEFRIAMYFVIFISLSLLMDFTRFSREISTGIGLIYNLI